MGRFLAAVMVGSVALVQLSFAAAKPQQNAGGQSASVLENASGDLSTLPPPPTGRTTVVGGTIRTVDLVRDQVSLKVFGGQSMKILFDARTQVYRDGTKTSLQDLRPEDHASVQTVLDGTNVFAVSIHILSQPPEGQYQGQVLNFNPGTRRLTVSTAMSRQPLELRVPIGTPVVRRGQDASSSATSGSAASGLSDLVKGSLVSIQFESDNKGRGVASRIAILASPGAAFVFSGNITFLDMHRDLLVLADPRDNKSYQIFFDPARFPMSRDLHKGNHVIVTANFDGARYVASAMKVS